MADPKQPGGPQVSQAPKKKTLAKREAEAAAARAARLVTIGNVKGMVRPQDTSGAEKVHSKFKPTRHSKMIWEHMAYFHRMQQDAEERIVDGIPVKATIPIIRGGSELGKTFSVRQYAAHMGYKYFDMVLNNSTEVSDITTKLIPNPNYKKRLPDGKIDDEKYIFIPSDLIKALRPNGNQVNMINIDELATARPGVLVSLFRILDAYDQGVTTLKMDELGEGIPIDVTKIRFAATTNPMGSGYFDRYPIDAALKRRGAPLELSDELTGPDVLERLNNAAEDYLKKNPLLEPVRQYFQPLVDFHMAFREEQKKDGFHSHLPPEQRRQDLFLPGGTEIMQRLPGHIFNVMRYDLDPDEDIVKGGPTDGDFKPDFFKKVIATFVNANYKGHILFDDQTARAKFAKMARDHLKL